MAEITKKLTRKEKIAAGLPKAPKRKTAYAEQLREARWQGDAQVELNSLRCTAQKARLVIDQIRGMEVFNALNVLKFTAKTAAPPVAKLIKSAISSYEEKYESKVDVGTHYVKTIYADGGPMLKRMLPAPQGRAYVVRKRFCHITLVIDRIPEGLNQPTLNN